MGTDVHAVWQAKKGGKWVDIESTWEQDRHYFLFAWLADVRNGFGFAGIPTHAPIKPIAPQRGLPDDFEVDGDVHYCPLEAIDPSRRQYMDKKDLEKPYVRMGDHSFSWLSADEILATPLPDKVWQTGIVPIEWFAAWDGKEGPDSWSGGISGKDIHVAEAPTAVNEKTTHVRIYWIKPGDTLKYFVDEVARLKALHGEVRLVFGFDS